MKTILILAASLLIAAAVLVISLRILQWLVTGVCTILSAAIDFFREVKEAIDMVGNRLRYLGAFIRKSAAIQRAKTLHRMNHILYKATPAICHMLALTSWMLSRASRNVYLRYHNDKPEAIATI